MTEEELAALAARLREADIKAKAKLGTPLAKAAVVLEPYAKAAGKPTPRYRTIYGKVLDGTIAAEKVGGQWFLRDVPSAAQALGLST